MAPAAPMTSRGRATQAPNLALEMSAIPTVAEGGIGCRIEVQSRIA